jgi:hypothetical protein
MKTTVLIACSALATGVAAVAGTGGKAVAPAAELTAPPLNPWSVTVTPYGWLAGLDGTTGVKGVTAETSVGIDQILSNLDMVGMMNVELQRGRWGGWMDGLYLKMSAGADTPGPLLSSVDVSVEQIAAEAAVFYRLWEGEKGFVDVYAGARYMSVGADLRMNVTDAGIREAADALSRRAVERIGAELRDRAPGDLGGKVAAAATARAVQAIKDFLGGRERPVAAVGLLAGGGPGDGLVGESGPVRDALRAYADARVAAAKAGAADRVDAAVARAEKRLAKAIERRLNEALPAEVSGRADWVDPFVGVRGRYQLSPKFYVAGKADIGGFGVSSELVWQVYGGVGWQMSKRTALELGYKYFAIDYSDGGFMYDVANSGVMTAFSIKF